MKGAFKQFSTGSALKSGIHKSILEGWSFWENMVDSVVINPFLSTIKLVR